jgi:RIO kinase 2
LSSAQVAIKVIRELEPEDYRVLKALERSMTRFDAVPFQNLERLAKLDSRKLRFRLDRLNQFGFVMGIGRGYMLVSPGLDVLALNELVKKNLISGMGRSIGMGKESDVFEVINDTGEKSAIKFYRIGRISFRATRTKRSYANPESHHKWMEISKLAALKEERGLEKTGALGVDTPRFIARNRHAVLMSEIEGPMLHEWSKDEINNPSELLSKILENARKAYVGAGIINGDLSEYNILYDGERPWIIDWPQFVLKNHPNAEETLKRDIDNIVSFFQKKFGLRADKRKALAFVKGTRPTL